MESSGGAEITVFELKVCDSDVENLLRVISDCVSGAVSGVQTSGENMENDPRDNPLLRAQKHGFTYLYPREKCKIL